MTSPNPKLKFALLISGAGTTMQAIISACKDGRLPKIEPVLIIGSSYKAGGLLKARALGFMKEDIVVIDPKSFPNKEGFGNAILKECNSRGVQLIGQYGWHPKTPDNVVSAYKNMIINQHPGPLDNGRPDFGGPGMYGMRVLEARLEFVRRTGHDFWTEATAHFVTSEFDKGTILKRRSLAILPNDTAESLQKSLLPIEHEVQIETLHDFIEGHVTSFIRKIPLIEKNEEKILEECKKNAKKVYPNG